MQGRHQELQFRKPVLVMGPLVLFSHKTSVVAAGAVAEAIEPKSNPRAIEVASSPVKRYPCYCN